MMRLPYQKLLIWQKGMELVKIVYKLTKQFPKEELYGLTSQMRRSAVSIPANIAEGSQRSSDKDFSNFVLIARGSLAELETEMLVAQDLQYGSESDYQLLFQKMDEISKMLRAFHTKLIANRYPLTANR